MPILWPPVGLSDITMARMQAGGKYTFATVGGVIYWSPPLKMFGAPTACSEPAPLLALVIPPATAVLTVLTDELLGTGITRA